MTDENNNNSSEQPLEANPGATLKAAREKAGLSIDDIAQKLYLKASAVDAIENNQLDSSKSVTFTKGYVKNYAKVIGLDVDAVVSEFERFHNRPEDPAKLQSFSKRVAKQAHDDRWMMVTYFILIIILGGVVWWWVQQPPTTVGEVTNSPPPATQVASQPSQPTALTSEVEQSPPVTVVQADSANTSENLPETDSALNEPVTAIDNTSAEPVDESTPNDIDNASQNTAEQPEQTLAEPAEPIQTVIGDESATNEVTVSTQASGSNENPTVPLVFTFSQDCWVNIIDGTGEAIAYGVKVAGRVMAIEGVPPFEITLGLPQAVAIEYDGEPVDMSGFSGNQIARLVLPKQD